MSLTKQKCLINFNRIKKDELDVFAVGVRDGIFQNAGTFAMPPIPEPLFYAQITGYVNTRGAYVQGGKAQKGPFLAAQTALIGSLTTFAEYVDTVAGGDANIITLAGFVPTKPVRSAAQVPAKPTEVVVQRANTGELVVDCKTVPGALFYGCILTRKEPLPDEAYLNNNGQFVILNTDNNPAVAASRQAVAAVFDWNKSKKKRFLNLIPGERYYFYFYAGNAAGISLLSDPVSAIFA